MKESIFIDDFSKKMENGETRLPDGTKIRFDLADASFTVCIENGDLSIYKVGNSDRINIQAIACNNIKIS